MIHSLLFYSSLFLLSFFLIFFFNDPATTEIYTLSLHDALPIFIETPDHDKTLASMSESEIERLLSACRERVLDLRSEEHTSELQSRGHLVCRLLLEKKKKKYDKNSDNYYVSQNDTLLQRTLVP